MIKEMKAIRQQQGVSLKRLAALSGICIGTLENWEYAGAAPTTSKFNTVLKALGYELQIHPIQKDN